MSMVTEASILNGLAVLALTCLFGAVSSERSSPLHLLKRDSGTVTPSSFCYALLGVTFVALAKKDEKCSSSDSLRLLASSFRMNSARSTLSTIAQDTPDRYAN
jgi:hypothetical protein